MTNKKNQPNDFEERYFDLIQDTLSRFESKLDTNTSLTQKTKAESEKTNGKVAEMIERIAKLEAEVFNKIKSSDLPPWYRDPKIISTIFNISILLLILVAAITRTDLAGFL